MSSWRWCQANMFNWDFVIINASGPVYGSFDWRKIDHLVPWGIRSLNTQIRFLFYYKNMTCMHTDFTIIFCILMRIVVWRFRTYVLKYQSLKDSQYETNFVIQTVSVREQRGIDTEQSEGCFISREKLYIECVYKTYIKSKMKRNWNLKVCTFY